MWYVIRCISESSFTILSYRVSDDAWQYEAIQSLGFNLIGIGKPGNIVFQL